MSGGGGIGRNQGPENIRTSIMVSLDGGIYRDPAAIANTCGYRLQILIDILPGLPFRTGSVAAIK